jgi:hypothetical protein
MARSKTPGNARKASPAFRHHPGASVTTYQLAPTSARHHKSQSLSVLFFFLGGGVAVPGFELITLYLLGRYSST